MIVGLGRAALCAAAAIAAALPLLSNAAPPQPAAAAVILPVGTIETIVLQQRADSASTEPGSTISARLHSAIKLRDKILAPAGTEVRVVVTETRRAGAGASGELFLRVEPIHLAGDLQLPIRLLHPVLTPLLVAANREDVVLPANTRTLPKDGGDLILPPGTILRAKTTATLDATNPEHITLQTPPPYTISTTEPYAAFTPIPLFTYDPHGTPQPRRGKRPTHSTITPSPTPVPSVFPSESPPPETRTPGPGGT